MKNIAEFINESIDRKFKGSFNNLTAFADLFVGGVDLEDVCDIKNEEDLVKMNEYIQSISNVIKTDHWNPSKDYEEGDDIWDEFYKDTKVNKNQPVIVSKDKPWGEVCYTYITGDKRALADVSTMFAGYDNLAIWKNNL